MAMMGGDYKASDGNYLGRKTFLGDLGSQGRFLMQKT